MSMNAKSPSCRRWRETIRLQAIEPASPEQAEAIEMHLAACEDCCRYARELRSAAAGLRWMVNPDAEPSADFRRRWTSAVEGASRGSSFEEAYAALLDWCRRVIAGNWRPLTVLAPVWLLSLVFRFSAPDLPPPAPGAVAHSPTEIYHALKAQTRLLAKRDSDPDLDLPPPPPRSPAPRSNTLPTAPGADKNTKPNPVGTLACLAPAFRATEWTTLSNPQPPS